MYCPSRARRVLRSSDRQIFRTRPRIAYKSAAASFQRSGCAFSSRSLRPVLLLVASCYDRLYIALTKNAMADIISLSSCICLRHAYPNAGSEQSRTDKKECFGNEAAYQKEAGMVDRLVHAGNMPAAEYRDDRRRGGKRRSQPVRAGGNGFFFENPCHSAVQY